MRSLERAEASRRWAARHRLYRVATNGFTYMPQRRRWLGLFWVNLTDSLDTESDAQQFINWEIGKWERTAGPWRPVK